MRKPLTQANGGESVDTDFPPLEVQREDFVIRWTDLFGACAVVALIFGLCGYFPN